MCNGVIEPIHFCDWATPIAPVVKKDRSVRICGNYKLTTIIQAAKTDSYPLPCIQDLFASLEGGKHSQSLTLLMHINRFPWMNKQSSM